MQVVRNEAGDLVEKVEKIDSFVHPKTGRHSQAFRVIYRDMSRWVQLYACCIYAWAGILYQHLRCCRSLTNEEVDEVQWRVRESLVNQLGVELR